MDESLPRKYNELDEVQLDFLDQQAESVLVAPSKAEIKLKSVDLFNKAQKGIKNIEDETGGSAFIEFLDKGASYIGKSIASMPETLFDFGALPQNTLADMGVIDKKYK